MHSLAFTYVTHATLLGRWSTCWRGVGVHRRDWHRGGLCYLVFGGRPRSQSPCWLAGDCNEWTTGLYIFFAAKLTECPVAESIKVAHWVSEWVEGGNIITWKEFQFQTKYAYGICIYECISNFIEWYGKCPCYIYNYRGEKQGPQV